MELPETENIMQMIESNLNSMEDMFLTFTLYQQYYGLKIQYITEIIRMQKITVVPDVAPAIKGVINLRGQVIPVMDIRTRFNIEVGEYDDRTCIIVLSFNQSVIGWAVDRIAEVIHIPGSKVQPSIFIETAEHSPIEYSPTESSPAECSPKKSQDFITGLGKVNGKVIFLLDVDKLIYGTFDNNQ